MKNKNIDFLKVYNRKPEMSSGKKSLFVFIGAVAAVFGVAVIGMNSRLRALDAQCKSERAYISDASVQDKYASYEETLSEYNRELALSDELREAMSAVKSYPTLNSPVLRAVNTAAGDHVNVESYEYSDETGALRLTGYSKDVFEASNYANRLEELDRFLGVGYHGYALEGEGNSSYYYFEDECQMKPGSAAITTQR